MTDLIRIQKGEPVVSTEILAEGFGVTHQAVLKLIKKYDGHFQDIRKVGFEIRASGKNQTIKFFHLDEEQTAFLGTLLKNTSQVVAFKRRLTKEFFRMRRTLVSLAAQKQNAEWLETRQVGKISRKQETDTIKEFVEYATFQGSQNAAKYYINISTMENKALFILEQVFPKLRDILTIHQLTVISVADRVVSKALRDGMDQKLPYKDIYRLAKVRVESLAEIHGKTFIPSTQAIDSKPRHEIGVQS